MSIPTKMAARAVGVLNIILSAIVILFMSSEHGHEKVGILLGIDVSEFNISRLGNREDTHADYVQFKVWCYIYAASEFVFGFLLVVSTIMKWSGLTIPWFLHKFIGIVVQFIYFLRYLIQSPHREIEVVVIVLYNWVFTAIYIAIVYSAAVSWTGTILYRLKHIRSTLQERSVELQEQNQGNEGQQHVLEQPQGSAAVQETLPPENETEDTSIHEEQHDDSVQIVPTER
ncbi:uncharacterized protein [Periplaneta americana]|uniref:uncharacterized protein n=1 Tax=Periplaneta americana TaxID=6978 RepID=UPI0037E7B60C